MAADYDTVKEWLSAQKMKHPRHLPKPPTNVLQAARRLQERLGNTNAQLSPWLRVMLRLED